MPSDHPGGRASSLQRSHQYSCQPLMEVRGRDHLRQGVVMPGKVGTQGGDHYVGTTDGLRDEVGVEDVGTDQDLDLAAGRDGRPGPVDGSDRMFASSSKLNELLADGPRGSKDGNVHSHVCGGPLFPSRNREETASPSGWLNNLKQMRDTHVGVERSCCENQAEANAPTVLARLNR